MAAKHASVPSQILPFTKSFPHSPRSAYDSRLETVSSIAEDARRVKPECPSHSTTSCRAMQGCKKDKGSNELVPIRYLKPGKPCEPEHVHPRPAIDWRRKPKLPEPPEMLSNIKRGIRHPYQITYRKKKMETQLDKLTDEHRAFAFPPDTRPFLDDAYYFTKPGLSFMENHDIVTRDIGMQQFLECPMRPALLAFNGDKYKFFRGRLPMPDKRILNIPSIRTTHWHNWFIRPLRTTYCESWRTDIKVPENWFGPTSSNIC